MIILTVDLFNQSTDTLEYYQDKFRYIMVDEYQDTNHCQYLLVRALAAKHHNICVVGDDDQSIYSFRGADINNILDFEKDYPEVTTMRLEQNYRSTKNILDAARSVITKNLEYNTIDLKSHRITQQNPIIHYTLQDSDQEAEHVIKIIRYLTEECDYKFSDIAVFYRSHLVANKLENRLIDENQSVEEEKTIPFQRIGGEISFREQFAKNVVSCLLYTSPSPRDRG